jgi:threonine/homoserine/homoserine lactone efflux protein
MLAFITQGILLGVSVSVIPGPFQTYLLSQTLRAGWKKSLPIALIPLVSDLPIAALMILVLTHTSPAFINILKIVGGLFVISISLDAFRTAIKPVALENEAEISAKSGFLKGLLISYLNPNVYIFWGTVGGPIVVEGFQQSVSSGLGFLLGMYGTLVPILALFIFVMGSVGRINPKVQRILSIGLAVILFCFGGYLIWQGAQAFLI